MIIISCSPSEIPAAQQLLAGLGCEKVEPVRAPPALQEAQVPHSEKARMTREKIAKKIETDTKPTQGSYPLNFYEAPIDPLPKAPPDPGKNKYGRWDTPISGEIDVEITRLHHEGKSTHEISAMLSERDINITWQRVRGRIAYMARKGHKSPVTEVKPPEVQSPEKVPDTATEGKPDTLHMRIIDLDRQKMTPHTISDVLEEEMGAVVSEAEIMDVIVKHAKGELSTTHE
jgi:hypothetical protein